MSGLHGHDVPVAAFRAGLAVERLHHAWLLTGPTGVGKARFADLAARYLLATAAGPKPTGQGLEVPADHPVASLLDAGSHPDFRRLQRLEKPTGELARSITVDQVRSLSGLFGSTPFLSPWRVAVVDSIDDLEPPAANALLKSLEEPPANCLFLLVSHAPASLLPTIKSRCLHVRFEALNDKAMTSALCVAAPDMSASEIAELVAAGEGSPGLALQRRGLNLAAIDGDLARLSGEGDPLNKIRSALSSKLALKSAQPRYELFLDRAPRHIAAVARTRCGRDLAHALGLWEKASALSRTATSLSLDPTLVTFELAGMVAALAPNSREGRGTQGYG